MSHKRHCNLCGKKREPNRSNYSVCEECKKLQHTAHIEVSRKAADVVVFGSCQHTDRPMVKHHFDYHKPLEVFLMCPLCHSYEHASINKCLGHDNNDRSPDTNNQRTVAKYLGVSDVWLNRIINGHGSAGYDLAVKLSEEIGGTVKLWKRGKKSKRKIVWLNYLNKLEEEQD